MHLYFCISTLFLPALSKNFYQKTTLKKAVSDSISLLLSAAILFWGGKGRNHFSVPTSIFYFFLRRVQISTFDQNLRPVFGQFDTI
jgi:hypothetical protein